MIDITQWNNDEWNGFADLLANLIEKYAAVLDIDNLPEPLVYVGEKNNKVHETEKNLQRRILRIHALMSKGLRDIIVVKMVSKLCVGKMIFNVGII